MSTSFWDDVKSALNTGAAIIADKSEEYLEYTLIKKEILQLKHQQRKLYKELGEKTYKILSRKKDAGVASNLKIKELIKRIKHVQSNLKKQEKELQDLKKEAARKKKNSSPVSEKKKPTSRKTATRKTKKTSTQSTKTSKGKTS